MSKLENAETIQKIPLESRSQPSKTRSRIYYLLCFTNILLNIDQGVLPACTNELMQDLTLEEVKFGTIGSMMFIGLIAGSFIAGYMFQRFSNKKVLLINLALVSFSLSVFTITKNFILLAISRVFTGFFQVFLIIFCPVWVDLYGKEKKTVWLSILQVGVPMGTFLGYILTVFSVAFLHWKWGFWLQIILLIPSTICLILFKESDLDTQNQESKSFADSEISMSYSLEVIKEEENLITDQDLIQMDRNSKFFGDESNELSYFGSLLLVLRSRIFLLTMLAISALYFVVTGIQYWMTDYLRNVLKQDKNLVFLTYSILSITAPTFGAIFGGVYVNYKGGYNSDSALKICVHFGIMAVLCACPFPFIRFYFLAVALLWFLLFFGGAMMPCLTGIMISSVPKKFRAFGNSTAQIFLNLLGFLPSPFLYGLICELTGGRESQWGMVLVMFWSILGLTTIAFAYFHDKDKRFRKKTDLMQKLIPTGQNENGVQMEKVGLKTMKSERKLTIPQDKSFDSRKNVSADHGLRSSYSLNLAIQKSIVGSFDLSLIKTNSRRDSRKASEAEVKAILDLH